MKRLLCFSLLWCICWMPQESFGASAFKGVCSFFQESIWGPTAEARKVVQTQGEKPDTMGSDPKVESSGATLRQTLYAVAHLATGAIISYAIGDWVGLYADIGGGAIYSVVTAGVTTWGILSTVGNNRLFPAHLLTNAFNGELPLAKRATTTALTVAGTGLGVLWFTALPALAAGHKTQGCLESYPFRNFASYLIGILLIEKGGEVMAKKLMPSSRWHLSLNNEEEEETTSILWHVVEGLPALSSKIAYPYWMLLTYRGWLGFYRTCEEKGYGIPNPLDDPKGFRSVEKLSFLHMIAGGGVMINTLVPYLQNKGEETGRMVKRYVASRDPFLLVTLGVSAIYAGVIGGAAADYMLKVVIPGLGPLISVEDAVGSLVYQVPTLSPYADPALIPAFTVFQAAHGWYPTDASPSSALVDVVRSGCVISALALTSLVQEGMEGIIRALLTVTDKKPSLVKALNRSAAIREIKAQGPYLPPYIKKSVGASTPASAAASPVESVVNPIYVGKK